MSTSDRGCVFFNFGVVCALRLLVSVFTLRRVYDGPITTFLARGPGCRRLAADLDRLDSEVGWVDRVSKSWDRHRIFDKSPYATTLLFDSDLVFRAPIDDLWSLAEREGVLVTRFYPSPYGVDGTRDEPGFLDRVALLEGVRDLVDPQTFASAAGRLLEERIDVNAGVMGIARPAGEAFLADWATRMERGRSRDILLLDEMLVVALLARHRHYLAGEEWNCPADEYFRRTNLADARIIHYFADGYVLEGTRLGRNAGSWAGRKWVAAYQQAAEFLDLAFWKRADPTFPGPRAPSTDVGGGIAPLKWALGRAMRLGAGKRGRRT